MKNIEDIGAFLLQEDDRRWFEKEWFDRELAEITLEELASESYRLTKRTYISMETRDRIKKRYGKRLPKGFAGPHTPMDVGSIIGPLVDDAVYFDDADLVKGDKTMMTLTPETTWRDVLDVVQKIAPVGEKSRRSQKIFGRY